MKDGAVAASDSILRVWSDQHWRERLIWYRTIAFKWRRDEPFELPERQSIAPLCLCERVCNVPSLVDPIPAVWRIEHAEYCAFRHPVVNEAVLELRTVGLAGDRQWLTLQIVENPIDTRMHFFGRRFMQRADRGAGIRTCFQDCVPCFVGIDEVV